MGRVQNQDTICLIERKALMNQEVSVVCEKASAAPLRFLLMERIIAAYKILLDGRNDVYLVPVTQMPDKPQVHIFVCVEFDSAQLLLRVLSLHPVRNLFTSGQTGRLPCPSAGRLVSR